MAMEKENLTHFIEDDLQARNRNWEKVDEHIGDGNAHGLDVTKQTLDAHLAESANKHIHSSGSNVNGSFIKFDDGTMICYIRGFRITGNGSVYVNSSVPLPADFIDVNYTVNVTPTGRYRVSDGGGQSTKYFNATVVSQYSDTIGNLRFMYGDGSVLESTFEFEVNILAVGRWR